MKGKTKLASQLVKKGVPNTGCRHGPELIPKEGGWRKKLRQHPTEVTFTEAPSTSADFLFVSLRPIIMSVVSRVMSQLFPLSRDRMVIKLALMRKVEIFN